MQKTLKPYIDRPAVLIFGADNGVVEEGVASAPQSVTLMQTINFTRRITGVSSMAKYFGIDLLVTDVGVAMEIPEELYTDSMLTEDGKITRLIVNRRIADGTANLAKGPAMTREQALTALNVGLDAAEAFEKAGVQLMGIGEMGIGNTTTSTALITC